MKRILLKLISIYQSIPFSSHKACRFIPTCSDYCKEAIEEYGAFKGSLLGIKRIFRCRPFGSYGFDPVPKKGVKNEKNS